MIKVERCSKNNITVSFFAPNLSFLPEYEDEHEVGHSMRLRGNSSVSQLVSVLPITEVLLPQLKAEAVSVALEGYHGSSGEAQPIASPSP